MYRPLNECITQSDELKKLITENPDLPIVVMVDYEICGDDFRWWFAPKLRFEIGDFLDCKQPVNDEKVYDDIEEFGEELENYLVNSGEYDSLSDEEFEKIVDAEIAKYEPYWKKVIYIYASMLEAE